MRFFLVIIVLGVAGYAGYRYWGPESTGDGGGSPFVYDEGTSDGPKLAGDEPLAPANPSELDALRTAIHQTRSPEGDSDRRRLYRLLIAEGTAAARREAETLIRQMESGGGRLSDWAANQAFVKFDEGAAKIEKARAIVARGPNAGAFALAAEALGDAAAQTRKDSGRVEAWEHYSDAYFALDDDDGQGAEARARLREKLDPIVDRIVFSPYSDPRFEIYTVQSGDSLDRIARKFKTTVETIQRVNRLDTTIIHPKDKLKVLGGDLKIIVDKTEFRLDVQLNGRYLFSSPVGLGKDGRTPIGGFVIETRQTNPDWFARGRKVPYGDPENPLGNRWLGFKDTDQYDGFGIHGTDEPDTIGTESSAGCVRLRDAEVKALFALIPRGTAVSIRE
ncbi:MAG: L,D-transpeptidase family protein [Planctomycetota bacterium]